MDAALEQAACTPAPLDERHFNPRAYLPYGCTVDNLRQAMTDFLDFLGFINTQLHTRSLPRLESLLMPANFSSIVGEFTASAIPRYCAALAKNRYPNGHPDLIPASVFPDNAAQYSHEGIEIKASRYRRGWQGHNAEAIWLLVLVFDSSRPTDLHRQIAPRPFRFVMVAGAALTRSDWHFSGRSSASRRTITASVNQSGCEKMMSNLIYDAR